MIQFDEHIFQRGLQEPTSFMGGRVIVKFLLFLLLCKNGNFLMNQFTSFQKAFKFICSGGRGEGRLSGRVGENTGISGGTTHTCHGEPLCGFGILRIGLGLKQFGFLLEIFHFWRGRNGPVAEWMSKNSCTPSFLWETEDRLKKLHCCAFIFKYTQ